MGVASSCLGQEAYSEATALTLHLEAQDVTNGFPQGFVYIFQNNSQHDVLIPEPSTNCGSSDSVWLRMHVELFQPPKWPRYGHSCAADTWKPLPILERIHRWKRIAPGESLAVPADRRRLYWNEILPGRYDVWAEYQPPHVSPEDRNQLLAAGIYYSDKSLSSNHVQFVKKQ